MKVTTYKVIKAFLDLENNNHAYEVGKMFPYAGRFEDQSRLDELSSDNNKQGEPLIEKIVTEVEQPKKAVSKERIPYTVESLEGVDLNSLTLLQLKEVGKDLEVEKVYDKNKSELIKEIQEIE